VNLKLVVEGSEEQGTGGLEDFVPKQADLLRADAILVCDTGNAAVGEPEVTVSLRGMANVVVHVEALPSEMHSGMFGGPAPDALAALVWMLASWRDADGNTTVQGLRSDQTWTGAPYDPDAFRSDAGLSARESLLGSGTVSDMLWARPALTILGIDCPPVLGSTAAIVPPCECPPEPAHPTRHRSRASRGGPRRAPAGCGAVARHRHPRGRSLGQSRPGRDRPDRRTQLRGGP
jgi:acetylornithine deacetylase/succinyl-diaminopimelate desuccinylase-like protein